MRKKVSSISLIVLVFMQLVSKGQGDEFNLSYNLPNYFNPNQSIEGFTKIVLYEIEQDGLSLPISISFDNTGIRYNETIGCLGLKWNLNIGAFINRQVNSSPDEQKPGGSGSWMPGWEYYSDNTWGGWIVRTREIDLTHYLNPSNCNTIDAGKVLTHNMWDILPDQFYFSIPNYNGEFFLGRGGEVKQSNSNDMVINHNLLFNDSLSAFTIKDNQGIYYKFQRGDFIRTTSKTSYSSNVPGFTPENIEFPELCINYKPFDIISPNGENIAITYINDLPITTSKELNELIEYPNPSLIEHITILNTTVLNRKLIKSIITSNEIIVFNYSALEGEDYYLLDNIFITRKDGSPLKTIFFKYEKNLFFQEFQTGNAQLKEIYIEDKNEDRYPFRSFTYKLPNQGHGNSFQENKQDYFGYFTNNSESHLFAYPTSTINSANRNPNKELMDVGNIDKIYLPTGGYIQFFYSPKLDTINFDPSDLGNQDFFYTGGLKVDRIKYFNQNGTIAYHKEFRYKNLHGGSGIFFNPNIPISEYKEQVSNMSITYVRDYLKYPSKRGGTPLNNYRFLGGDFYEIVETYEIGSSGEYNGKVENTYCLDVNSSDLAKRLSKTKVFNQQGDVIQQTTYEWESPVYANDKGGVYLNNLEWSTIYVYPPSPDSPYGNLEETFIERHVNLYDIKWKPFYHEVNSRLSRVNDSYSVNGGNIIKEKTFLYNSFGNISQSTESSSEGSLLQITKYVKDLYNEGLRGTPSPDVRGLNYLYQNNLNRKVEIIELRDNKVVGAKLYIYSEGFTKPVKELRLEVLTPIPFDNSFNTASIEEVNGEVKLIYNEHYKIFSEYKYDAKGYIIESKSLGSTNSFIFGYNNTYPIARIVNSLNDFTAHTSFEFTDNKGGWNFNGTPSLTGHAARTGRYVYKPYSAAITKNIQPGTYELSYWQKGGTITISGGTISAISQSVANSSGWVMYRKKVIITSITTLTISGSSTSQIDELRLHPIDAQMETYIWNPGVGVETVTDVNGRSIYYKYDGIGRLIEVRDEDGKIQETREYQFKQ